MTPSLTAVLWPDLNKTDDFRGRLVLAGCRCLWSYMPRYINPRRSSSFDSASALTNLYA
jgi:hypothetical protein